MARAFLCVSIDTECDKGRAWRSQKPISFRGIHDGIGKRLAPLFAAFGAKPTYLVSPEVLRDASSIETLRRLARSCELGAHLHGEYADPGAFEPDTTRVFQRDYPRELEREKLVSLTRLFMAAFGRRPASFRAGRFGIGPASIPILESLEYVVDSSVTPHMDWSRSGAPGLSFRGAPTQPYRPAHAFPERRGGATLLEVPVTIRRRFANAVPALGRHIEPRWLRPTRSTADALIKLAKEEILEATLVAPARPVVLNAMFHNVEVVPDASPYAESERDATRILDRVHALLAFAKRESISVVGLADIPEILGL